MYIHNYKVSYNPQVCFMFIFFFYLCSNSSQYFIHLAVAAVLAHIKSCYELDLFATLVHDSISFTLQSQYLQIPASWLLNYTYSHPTHSISTQTVQRAEGAGL